MYKVGDTISYKTFDDKIRTVKVTAKMTNKGRPGFDGVDIKTGKSVWGYDSQIRYPRIPSYDPSEFVSDADPGL